MSPARLDHTLTFFCRMCFSMVNTIYGLHVYFHSARVKRVSHMSKHIFTLRAFSGFMFSFCRWCVNSGRCGGILSVLGTVPCAARDGRVRQDDANDERALSQHLQCADLCVGRAVLSVHVHQSVAVQHHEPQVSGRLQGNLSAN